VTVLLDPLAADTEVVVLAAVWASADSHTSPLSQRSKSFRNFGSGLFARYGAMPAAMTSTGARLIARCHSAHAALFAPLRPYSFQAASKASE
jgi:hypothetical protein